MPYRIMIVEDEYWTAIDMATQIEERGAEVTGPFSSIAEAIETLRSAEQPHAAILDIRLRSLEVFPIADLLMQSKIPFVFATGYMKRDLPKRFAATPHYEKPFDVSACVGRALELAEAHSCGQHGFRYHQSFQGECIVN